MGPFSKHPIFNEVRQHNVTSLCSEIIPVS